MRKTVPCFLGASTKSSVETHKLDELNDYPEVNFVSVSERATVSKDRGMIRQLYKPDWKAWLGDEGGDRDGEPDDPRIALIEVTAESATYLETNAPRVITLFKVAKAIASGTPPKAGDLGHLERGELSAGQGRQ